ncbi:MAG: Fic family protein [Candidatus Saccharibacteria bacterium]|nr:Fic family protein [Candidatus Saccharibacteria bacterium]
MIGQFRKQASDYQAFIPSNFPSSLNYTPSTQTILTTSEATLYIGKLDGLTRLIPNIDFFAFMYHRKEATLSSNIEGTQATMHDFLKAEAEIKEDTPRDIIDIQRYLKALEHGFKQLPRISLTSRLICEMHALLMSGLENSHATPGQFRTSQNWIGGTNLQNASFIPPPANELNRCLKDLDNFINNQPKYQPSLIKIALTHAQFETIHPFLDGNGRIGRSMITLQLCQEKLLEQPIFYISEYLQRHRQIYFEKLDNYRFGFIDEWVQFFLDGVKDIAQSAIQSAEQLIHLQERDQALINNLGRQIATGNKLLKYLYQQPIVNIKQVAKEMQLSRQATYGLVKKFKDCGILQPVNSQSQRNIALMHKKYIDIF